MLWEAVIGLEIHVQLRTATKIFCRCPNRFGAPPNTLVCPVCLGYPGTLPALNSRAVDLAVELALALDATVHEESVFARKSYLYPDLPKGFQITQVDTPLAQGGALPLARHGKLVGLEGLHLEEDAGKVHHGAPGEPWRVDFNRAGVPLVEIVTRPQLASPDEAHDCLHSLHELLVYTGVSDANLEEGSLRCDANVSLRRRGARELGVKTEIKNLNSFRFLRRALIHEIERQEVVLGGGDRVVAETRGYDDRSRSTYPLRDKEAAADYRYLPEPDLPPVRVDRERRTRLAATLPELPWQRRRRLGQEHGVDPAVARELCRDRRLADYFEAAARAAGPGRGPQVAAWVRTEVLGELGRRSASLEAAPEPVRLGELVVMVAEGAVSSTAAKRVWSEMWDDAQAPARIVERLGLGRVDDAASLVRWAREVLATHPREVAAWRAGKHQLLGFFVGRLMDRSGGRADPRVARRTLEQQLAEGDGEDAS